MPFVELFLLIWLFSIPGGLANAPVDISIYKQPVSYGHLYESAYHTRKRQNSANVPTFSHLKGYEYYTVVNIGTPPMPYKLLISTGDADTWIITTDCTTCGINVPMFDAKQSSTFSSSGTTNISYTGAFISGANASDVVAVGGLSVAQQAFLAVSNVTNEYNATLVTSPTSGNLGFGLEGSSVTKTRPFMANLLEQGSLGTLTPPVMSFYFSRPNDSTTFPEQPGGTFTLGGTNSSLYTGEIEFLDVFKPEESFWQLSLSRLTVDGKEIEISTGNNSRAIFSTSYSFISGPATDVRNFWAAIPGSKPYTAENQRLSGYYSFPCTTNVSVAFSFGKRTWPISIADLTFREAEDDSTACIGTIFDAEAGGALAFDGDKLWNFGLPFFRNVYSVFRFHPLSIGLAQLAGAPPPIKPATKPNVGIIVGSLLGATAVIVAVIALVFFVRRRRRTAYSHVPPRHVLDGDGMPPSAMSQEFGSVDNEFQAASLYNVQSGRETRVTSMSSLPTTPPIGQSNSIWSQGVVTTPPSSSVGTEFSRGSSSPLFTSTSPPPPPKGGTHLFPTTPLQPPPPSPYPTAPLTFPQGPPITGGVDRPLTVEQLNLVQRLSEQNVHPVALTTVIQSLAGNTGGHVENQGTGVLRVDDDGPDAPPAYQ